MALPKAIAANKFAIIVAMAFAGLLIAYEGAAATSRGPGGFEAAELYPTKPGGREWFLNATEPRDGLLIISPAAAGLMRRPSRGSVALRNHSRPPCLVG